MAAIVPLKKATLHERMDGSSGSPKRSQYGKKMNGQLLLFFPNKMTHYFKVWTIEKNKLSLQKFDTSVRSS